MQARFLHSWMSASFLFCESQMYPPASTGGGGSPLLCVQTASVCRRRLSPPLGGAIFFSGLMLVVIRLRELNKSCTNYASRKEFVITHDHEKLGAAATYRTDSKCLCCVGCLCCPGYIHGVVCVGCRYCLHQSSNTNARNISSVRCRCDPLMLLPTCNGTS